MIAENHVADKNCVDYEEEVPEEMSDDESGHEMSQSSDSEDPLRDIVGLGQILPPPPPTSQWSILSP